MILSHYLKIYPSKRFQDRLLLFSTRKSSKIIISHETLEAIKAGELSQDEFDTLKELQIVVEDPEQERSELLHHFETANRENTTLQVVASLNFDCNLACPYCFENGVKCGGHMDGATEEKLIRFLDNQLDKGIESLDICYYGGEPLLSLTRLKGISSRLRAMAEAKGKTYAGSIITNGTLLTQETARELAKVGVTRAKVTLDGPPAMHNRRRPFKSGSGSFDVIVENLAGCCDTLDIELGGNYDPKSFPHFTELLDLLPERGLSPDKLDMVNFGPVFKPPASEPTHTDYRAGMGTTSEAWAIQAEREIRKALLERGYRTSKIRPMGCSANFEKSFVIDHNGLIYKCQNFIGKQKFSVGDLDTGVREEIGAFLPDHWKREECLDCEYLPMCFGGCMYTSYVNHGELKVLDCQREYLDKALEALVTQELDPEVF